MRTMLDLCFAFLKIGTLSFGGGYGMISLIKETVLGNGWMTEDRLLNFIAVSESTPGPIAINMATFIGSSQYGAVGSVLATLGVILPSLIIILIISSIIRGLLKYRGVQAFLEGVRPCVTAMILATAITTGFSVLIHFTLGAFTFEPDINAVIILACLILFSFIWRRISGKKPSSILMILFSAFLGLLFYGIL